MDKFAPSSKSSRSGTPTNSRFAAPAETAEDLLKSQTVGLVHLDDFRKRRAEVLEQKERAGLGTNTPQDGYVYDVDKLNYAEQETDFPSTVP
jgi:protein FAM50